jgi:hypothetical protein
MRMGMRRFARLTNASSKKVENHAAAVSLNMMWMNFGRRHKSLADPYPRTPAMAAGVADHIWTCEENRSAAGPIGRYYPGCVILYLVGWIVLMVAFGVTQFRFLERHRNVHGWWRPRSTPWMLMYSWNEGRAMWRATIQPDEDPRVERARRLYTLVLIIAVGYLVIGFPLALWLFGNK